MIGFVSKLWHWLINRSPRNAATPDVQSHPVGDASGPVIPSGSEPIEIILQTESITGMQSEVGSIESFLKGPDGQLIRANRKFAILLGCEHAVTQLQAVDQQDRHIRGIAGRCFYCTSQYQEQLKKGKITPFDAERLSLVCTDCGKVTTSGLLCCPKHYTAVTNPDGTIAYLGPEELRETKMRDTFRMILSPIVSLFIENGSSAIQTGQQEHNNEKQTD